MAEDPSATKSDIGDGSDSGDRDNDSADLRHGLSVESWAVAGGRPGAPGAPLNQPIVTASNFAYGGERIYSREDGTRTVEALEQVLGGMEGGSAVAFSAGMAAAAAVFYSVPSGALVAIPDDCYHGVASLVAEGQEKHSWQVEKIALDDTDGWKLACRTADIVWTESPSNPLLGVADLPEICAAKRKSGTLVCVDSTFATPLLQNPLAYGADVVMHSTTKFIGGHSDLLGGALVVSDDDVFAQLRNARTRMGTLPGALETFLTLRGCRTLPVRFKRAQATAMTLAQRLEEHPDVTTVRYPGLPSHPTHEVAKRVLRGFGAMISFDVAGEGERADRVCQSLELVQHATSLGGVESSIERRAVLGGQEHLPPTLLRLSVGCEGVDDLWKDLTQAIAASA